MSTKHWTLAFACTILASAVAAQTSVSAPVPVRGKVVPVAINTAATSTSIKSSPAIATWVSRSYPSVASGPTGWPASVPWEPRRYTGPFKHGSDFSQIKAVLSYTSVTAPAPSVQWNLAIYFGNYFTTISPAYKNIYQRYFGLTLPTAPVPAAAADTGTIFELTEIAYSSAYGGSVRLTFDQAEDYGLEALDNTQQVSWDVPTNTSLHLFIVPRRDVFNNPGLLTSPGTRVYAHLDTGSATRYERINNTLVLTAHSDDVAGTATSIAASLSDPSGSGVTKYPNLARFVYGFVNTQLLETYDYAHENITNLAVTDNSIDVTTAAKKEYALILFRIEDVYSNTDISGRDELSATVNHFLAVGSNQWITAAYNVGLGDQFGNGEDSRWTRVAQLTPEELDFYRANGGVWSALNLRESDPIADDLFYVNLTYDFGALTGTMIKNALTNATEQTLRDDSGASNTNYDEPWFTFRYKVIAVLR